LKTQPKPRKGEEKCRKKGGKSQLVEGTEAQGGKRSRQVNPGQNDKREKKRQRGET